MKPLTFLFFPAFLGGATFVQPVLAGPAEVDGLTLRLPDQGDHNLRVLSSTVLELVRINSQPTGGSVDSWAFVSGSQFSPPPAGSLVVLVDGVGVSPASIGFRRRPLYAPLKVRDLRIENRLYLTLETPVPEGAVVTVTNPDGTLWPASMVFSTTASPARISQAIHVNQEGYTSDHPKQAMVGASLGNLGELPLAAGTPFSVVDAASLSPVYSGTLTSRPDVGFTLSPLPYQQVLQADFSALTTPGEYRLSVPGLGVSLPFLIDDSMAMYFARLQALGLYQQRCGTAVSLPWSRHVHDACHTAPAFVPVPQSSYSAAWGNIASVNSNALTNPRHTAPRLENEASQLYPFQRTGTVDVSGGHHDAGDYSKYTINSAHLIHSLTFAADSMGTAGTLDNLGLPESGDGLSDLLQEAKHEADFLAKLQDTDGGFSFLVYPKDRKYEDNVLPDHGDAQVIWPKNTSATAAATAALAELGSSPLFQAQFPAASAMYLQKAQAGWQFLLQAIVTHGKDGSYQKLTHYGDVFMHDDELAWAASAMFVATGDPVCQAKLLEWYDPASRDTRRWSWWRLFEGYGCAARTYAFAARSGRLPANALDAVYLAKCEAEIIAAGHDIINRTAQTAYGTAFPSESKRFRNAGWYFSLDNAFDAAVAWQLSPSASAFTAVVQNLNFEYGTNPVNVCYVTGAGVHRQREIVHQYAQNDRRVLPPSGIPLGNLQQGFPWLSLYSNELGALTFPGDGAATGSYPFYDRWADTFNTSTEFVITNQGRALATVAWLAARTPAATQSWAGAAGVITLPSTWLPAGEPVTATLSAPGLDLSGARVVWEASGQEPHLDGDSWTFTAASVGVHWVEAEAVLPDGRRIHAAADFSTYTASGDIPWTADADTTALYHFDGSWQDSGPNGWHLTPGGGVTLASDNCGWMAAPAGQVARFSGIGSTLTLTVPDTLIQPGTTRTPLTIEARIYPRAWKAYGVGNYPLVSLHQWWDTCLEMKQLKWTTPKAPLATVGGNTVAGAAAWQAGVPLNTWHLLRLTMAADGTTTCSINDTVIGTVVSTGFLSGRTTPWTFTLGNFEGDLDEVRISRVVRP